jgi:hypothetical protein
LHESKSSGDAKRAGGAKQKEKDIWRREIEILFAEVSARL